MKTCPSCGDKINDGVFISNLILAPEKIAIINEYHTEKSEHRCFKCGDTLYAKFKDELIRERQALVGKIWTELRNIPILSLQAPLHWDYKICGLVTGQSTTGTGVFAEITSLFTDLVGAQSKVYNQKLKAGEDLCKSILRKEAFELGGNAVLAADIDYAEVGGGKGMLMVCMTGTAVVLKNTDILGEDFVRSFGAMNELKRRLDHLTQYSVPIE